MTLGLTASAPGNAARGLRGRGGARASARATMSWGMVCLSLYAMVAIGRIQEAITPLSVIHAGMLFGALTLIAWMSQPGRWADKIPLDVKPVKYVLLLLLLGVLTAPIGVWPGNSIAFLTGSFLKTVLLFLFVFGLCRSFTDVRRVIWGCGAGLTVLVVSGVLSGNLSRATDLDAVYEYASRTYDPNDLALVLVMMMPLWLYLFSTSGHAAKPLLVAMMLVGMYGIVLTQSRGGFLSLLVVGALVLRRSTLSRGQKTTIAVVALIVFGFMAGSSFWERIRTIWDPQTEYDRQAGGRTEIWKTGLWLMITHPWGVGIDGFVYAEGLSHGGFGKWAAAHNTFIQIGTDLGIAGLIAFVLMLKYAFGQLRAMQHVGAPAARFAPFARRLRDAVTRPAVPLLGKRPAVAEDTNHVVLLAASLELALIAFVIGGFFLSQAYGALLYVIVALTLVTARLAGRLPAAESRSWGARTTGGAGRSSARGRRAAPIPARGSV